MKRFILILLSFSLLSCSSESLEPEEVETDVSKFTEIGHGALTGSEGIPKSNLIIKDSGTWNELMQQMNSKNPETSNFTETEIDFKHYQIIAVLDRVYPKVGYTVDITKITEHETSVEVTVENLEIGGLLSATRQPYHIVKTPKTEKEVVFEKVYTLTGNLLTLYYEETYCADPWGRSNLSSDQELIDNVSDYLKDTLKIDYETIQVAHDGNTMVCNACSCTTGRTVRIEVDSAYVYIFNDLGFIIERN